jgi:hypothetical protein
MRRLTVSETDEQLILPLKTLIIKRASRCLLLEWSVKKFNLTKMSSYLQSHTPLKIVCNIKVQISFEFVSILEESAIVIQFQTTDAYSILERTRVLNKAKRLSRVGKEDAMYRIKPSIFKPCENT